MRLIIGRLLGALGTMFACSLFVFSMVRLLPGDPAAVLLGRTFNPEVARLMRARLGIDGSFLRQYMDWIFAAFRGDFGYSFINKAPVADQLFERFARTIHLLVGGVLVGLLISIPSGLIAAKNRGKWQDSTIMGLASFLLSVPQFVVGLVLVFIFSVKLGWLPAGGWVDPSDNLVGWFKAMILPWTCVGMAMSALTSRVLRASVINASEMEFTRTAKSWGLNDRQIARKHVYRNACIPTITVIGLEVGYLSGGAFVVEKIFGYPGLGQLTVDSISGRDYPMVQATVLLFALVFILVNLVVDVIQLLIDPRIRI